MRRRPSEECGQSGLSPFVVNDQFESGQLSWCWQGCARSTIPASTMLTLVDVPLVSAAPSARCSTGIGRPRARRPARAWRNAGHPSWLTLPFDKIRAADPQRGAKPIIRAHVSAAGDVEIRTKVPFSMWIPRKTTNVSFTSARSRH
jgi:CTP:molybdopterin cytidylyltransferase MocA